MGLITTLHEAERTGIPEQTLSFRLVVAFTVCGSNNRSDEAAHKTPFFHLTVLFFKTDMSFVLKLVCCSVVKLFTCVFGLCALAMLAVAKICTLWYGLMFWSKLLF